MWRGILSGATFPSRACEKGLGMMKTFTRTTAVGTVGRGLDWEVRYPWTALGTFCTDTRTEE